MTTCATCEEFCTETHTCNCPLNAYPAWDTVEFIYARTSEFSTACTFYTKVVDGRDSAA